MRWLKQHPGLIGATTIFLIFFSLAVAGGLHTFSPVPYWDMWGGTLGFFIAHSDGNTSIWWSLHNEHRIVLSRILFWLDYRVFGGTSVFLIVMNYVLVLSATAVFYRISLARLEPDPQARTLALITTGLIGAWLFQWMQEENLSWAFQSQFFLAQLLPLCALFVLFHSTQNRSIANYGDEPDLGINDTSKIISLAWFILACMLGVASAGTMANGVIALPLMTLYVLLMRQPWWQSGVLLILSIVTITLYFSDYNPPDSHGSLTETLLNQPLDAIHYVLLYLGTPFYQLFGQNNSGRIAAIAASSVMGFITLIALVRYARFPQKHGLALAMVFYIIFLAGTALGTAGGRLVFGVDQALTFRYTTPALMAWAAFLIICLPWITIAFRHQRIASMFVLTVTLVNMLSLQLNALEPKHQQIFDRAVAALALELGVRDEAQILTTYVMSDGLIATAEVASAYNLSVFGRYPWRDLRPELGSRFTGLPDAQCIGHLDTIQTIAQEEGFFAIRGWLFDRSTRKSPERIRIVTGAGVTAGFALTGQPRPDVAEAVYRQANLSGFAGYINSQTSGSVIRLIGENPACGLDVSLPDSPVMDEGS